ncbi:Ig-like domain-containing protein [Tenacibaculum sp. 190524A05c]|uniref:Ig-like domain-containing protein n=1 Tax=Tenacibaculum platacis TaxID=3137852 RepID=UPI0032B2726B
MVLRLPYLFSFRRITIKESKELAKIKQFAIFNIKKREIVYEYKTVNSCIRLLKHLLLKRIAVFLLLFISATNLFSQQELIDIDGNKNNKVTKKKKHEKVLFEKNDLLNFNYTTNYFVQKNKRTLSITKTNGTFSQRMPSPTIDLDGNNPGTGYERTITPEYFTIYNTVVAPAITADGNVIASATITFTGVVDSNENIYINDADATDGILGDDEEYRFTGSESHTHTYAGIQISVSRIGATFTITRTGGGTIPIATFLAFLDDFDYGNDNDGVNISPLYTEGVRTMTVEITDTGALTTSAQTTLNVYDAIVAVNDTNSVAANNTGTIAGNVLSNESAPRNGTLLVSEVDVYPASVGNSYTTLYGAITINSDGSYLYDVDENNPAVTGLRNGESIDDIISYTVERSVESSINDYAYLTVTINGVTDLPDAIDNADSVTTLVEINATGNVITDVGAGGVDVIDRGLSELVWENEFVEDGFGTGVSAVIGGTTRTIDGVQLDFSTSDPDNIGTTSNEKVFITFTNGGHTGYYRYGIDATTNPSAPVSLTIDFDEPVFNLGFLVVDIDYSQGTSWQDQIQIQGTLAGATSNFHYVTTGGVVDAGNNTFYGTGTAVPDDATGNVNVFFNQPIDRLVLTYNYGPDATAADQGGQIAGISDIYWQGQGAISVSAVEGVNGNVGTTVAGTYGSIVINADGSYDYQLDYSNNTVLNLLATDTPLTDTFQYTLSDGLGGFDSADLVITITGGGIDSDGDGIANNIDLDDDNDGIIDSEECSSIIDFSGGLTFTNQAIGNVSVDGTFVSQVSLTPDGNSSGDIRLGDDQASTPNPPDVEIGDEYRVDFSSAVEVIVRGAELIGGEFDNGAGGGDELRFEATGGFVVYDPDGQLNIQSQSSSHIEIRPTLLMAAGAGTWEIRSLNNVSTLTIKASGNPRVPFNLGFCPDTDGDGTSDYLDLDSDNDGCNDVVESGGQDTVLVDGRLDGHPTVDAIGTATVGQVTSGSSIGGYNGLNGDEIVATTVAVDNTLLISQLVDSDEMAVFQATAANATNTSVFSGGTPDYSSGSSSNSGINFQWYVGDPSSGGVAINASDTNYSGEDSIVLTIDDVSALDGTEYYLVVTHDDNVCIEIINSATLNVEQVPTATDDTATVNEDASTTITVSTNDDIGGDGGDGEDYSLTSGPSNGSVTETSDGVFVYTPNADFNGTDSFTYTITDADGDTDTATVVITVNSVDDAPDAVDDTATVNEDASTTIIVSTNDDIGGDGGDGEDYSLTSGPSNGTVTETSDGVFVYTPNADFNGTDSFTYTITDADGDTDTATVVITVNSVDDAPTATDDTATVNEDASTTITVSTNDDIGGDGGDGEDYSLTSGPSNGTVTETSDGVFVYTPNADFNGTDSFTYTITDADGDTDTATVVITVNSVDDVPTATDDTATVNEDASTTITVSTNDDIGGDGGDGEDYSLTSGPSNGSVTETSDGVFVYTPNADFNGTDSFTYTITDADGDTDTATVVITVNSVDDAPDAIDDTATVNEDASTTITVSTNDDIGGDGGDGEDYSLTSGPSNGTVTETSDGVFVYTPNADFNGTDSFTYTITDADGDTDTATVVITVSSVDDAPTATDDTATVNEDASTTITVSTNDDIGGDGGDGEDYSLTSGPSNGTVTETSDGVFVYTPNADFNGTDSFTYTITDADGDTDTATVVITVNSVDDVPTATDDTATVNEDASTTITVSTNDDIGGDGGDGEDYSLTSGPSNGTVTETSDGVFVYTPNADFNGTDSFTYTITDADGDTDTATVVITVNSVDDVPTATDDTATVNEDASTTITVSTNDDIGGDGGDGEDYSLTSGPSNGVLTETSDGVFVYTPNADFNGIDSFTYTITDVDGDIDTATVTITVVPDINLDTDNDGITDVNDLDDDNDGILDTNEGCLTSEQIVADLNFSGDAATISTTEFRLTRDVGVVAGSAQSRSTINFNQDFTFSFEINLGVKDVNGADGMAFILHNSPAGENAIGNSGPGLGAGGIANGIVIEFDTYAESGNVTGFGDVLNTSIDHTRIWDSDTGDSQEPGLSPPTYLTPEATIGNIEDGIWHNVVVYWNSTTNTLSYTFDGNIVGVLTGNLPALYFNGGTDIYYGFTASTGGLSNEHRVRNIKTTCTQDSDGDGTPDYLDLDSDNDGCNDVLESGGTDGNSDGRLDGHPIVDNLASATPGQVTGGLLVGGYDGARTDTSSSINYQWPSSLAINVNEKIQMF